jgi:5-methyltetrahydrofolate--homocysteine methyltransferase
MDWLLQINEAVVKGKKHDIARLAKDAVSAGIPAERLVDEAVIPAMNRVSELWRAGEYFVPEVMRAASTMQSAMEALRPYLVKGGTGKGIKVALGTVKGDLHDIGKNLVAIMLEGAGYQIENMGVDLPPDRFLQAARSGARVVGMSSLLTTSMERMRDVIGLFEKEGIRKDVTLMVGGAPVSEVFAKEIKADYYAKDAAEAVHILNRLFP